jgi:hypothetical protein
VKFFDRIERFQRELQVYQHLEARGIYTIAGHAVPELIGADEELWAIEMTIVDRPFLLDFAEARPAHEVPDFEPHVLQEYTERLKDVFDDRWTDAVHVAEMFRQATGFTLMDLHPGNIAFSD